MYTETVTLDTMNGITNYFHVTYFKGLLTMKRIRELC
jgi:hypothetical protein